MTCLDLITKKPSKASMNRDSEDDLERPFPASSADTVSDATDSNNQILTVRIIEDTTPETVQHAVTAGRTHVRPGLNLQISTGISHLGFGNSTSNSMSNLIPMSTNARSPGPRSASHHNKNHNRPSHPSPSVSGAQRFPARSFNLLSPPLASPSHHSLLMRLNSNANGNLVDDVSGVELTPSTFSIDRVINGIVSGFLAIMQMHRRWSLTLVSMT